MQEKKFSSVDPELKAKINKAGFQYERSGSGGVGVFIGTQQERK